MTFQVEFSKISSKGQVVIPKSMREQFREGEEILFIREGDRVIIKPANSLHKYFKEDIELSKRIDEAYKRYDNGDFISLSQEDFLEEIEKW